MGTSGVRTEFTWVHVPFKVCQTTCLVLSFPNRLGFWVAWLRSCRSLGYFKLCRAHITNRHSSSFDGTHKEDAIIPHSLKYQKKRAPIVPRTFPDAVGVNAALGALRRGRAWRAAARLSWRAPGSESLLLVECNAMPGCIGCD